LSVHLGAHTGRITLLSTHHRNSINPSIRVTYHPKIQKASQTGGFAFFADFNKTKSQSHIQRITVHNSKPVAISGVHIFDQIPVSEDERIKVSLVSPDLTVPGSEEATLGGFKRVAQSVKVPPLGRMEASNGSASFRPRRSSLSPSSMKSLHLLGSVSSAYRTCM